MPKKSKKPVDPENTDAKEMESELRGPDKVVEIKLSDITVDRKYQIRVNDHDEATVKEYQAIYKESPDSMEPIVCVLIDGVLYLAAGFQRHKSAGQAGRKTIRARVIEGDEKTAFRESLSSNKHGLKLSSGDKKKAIRIARKTFPGLPNTEIARMIGCVESYVRKVVKEDTQGRTGANPSDTDKDEQPNPKEKKKKTPSEKARNKSDGSLGIGKELSEEVDVSGNHASSDGRPCNGDDVDCVEALFNHIMETVQKFSDDEKKRLYDRIYDLLIEEGHINDVSDDYSEKELEESDDVADFDDSELEVDDDNTQ